MIFSPKTRTILKHLYPVVFVLSPVMALYAANLGEMPGTDLLRPISILLAAGLVLWFLLYLLLRDVSKASLSLTVLCVSFFLFDLYMKLFWILHDAGIRLYLFALGGYPSDDVDLQSALKFGDILWLLILVVAIWACQRIRRDLAGLAWLAGIIILGQSAMRIVTADTAYHKTTKQAVSQTGWFASNNESSVTKTRFDLYVVVLDAYARQDILRTMYGVDNEPFLKELESRGFVVARKSRANYMFTPMAISAALNMEYIPPDPNPGSTGQMQPFIDHNRIASMLSKQGYHFVSIPTGYPETATPSANLILTVADRETIWTAQFPTEFEGLLIQKTPARWVLTDPALIRAHGGVDRFDAHRRRLMAAFDLLGDAAKLPYPKFVFAHILAPHPPFVIGADGQSVSPVAPYFTLSDGSEFVGSHTDYRRGYSGQVRFVNRRIMQTIDTMHKNSVRPYVLVVMGDHGSREETDLKSLRQTNVHEVFSNLFAIYASPGAGEEAANSMVRDRMDSTITPINGFRTVLNAYFGSHFAGLPDRSYYSTRDRPRDFHDVTDALSRAESADTAAPR